MKTSSVDVNREPRDVLFPPLLPCAVSLALMLGLAACAGTSQPRPVGQDSGAPPPTYYDSGASPAPLDGSSWPQADSGSWPTLDGAASTGTLSCGGIWSCYDQCSAGDSTCSDACFYKGTADGQAKMSALEQCWSQAETTTCKTECASAPDSQACYDCEDKACAAELQACT